MNSRQNQLGISPRLVFFVLLCASCGLLASGVAHATYGTSGSLSMNSAGGPLINRSTPFGPLTEIADSDQTVGTNGSLGEGGYSASLPNGAISAWSSALDPDADMNTWGTATMNTFFQDDLTFTIPAGTYPSGVYAIAHVRVEGSVGIGGNATAQHEYSFSFGETVHVTTPAPAPPVSTTLTLTAELAYPGQVFNNPATRLRRINAALETRASAPGPAAGDASASISGEVLCIEVPPGVTWESESTVFPTACWGVPTLSSWSLVIFVAVLTGSGMWVTARRGWRSA